MSIEPARLMITSSAVYDFDIGQAPGQRLKPQRRLPLLAGVSFCFVVVVVVFFNKYFFRSSILHYIYSFMVLLVVLFFFSFFSFFFHS